MANNNQPDDFFEEEEQDEFFDPGVEAAPLPDVPIETVDEVVPQFLERPSIERQIAQPFQPIVPELVEQGFEAIPDKVKDIRGYAADEAEKVFGDKPTKAQRRILLKQEQRRAKIGGKNSRTRELGEIALDKKLFGPLSTDVTIYKNTSKALVDLEDQMDVSLKTAKNYFVKHGLKNQSIANANGILINKLKDIRDNFKTRAGNQSSFNYVNDLIVDFEENPFKSLDEFVTERNQIAIVPISADDLVLKNARQRVRGAINASLGETVDSISDLPGVPKDLKKLKTITNEYALLSELEENLWNKLDKERNKGTIDLFSENVRGNILDSIKDYKNQIAAKGAGKYANLLEGIGKVGKGASKFAAQSLPVVGALADFGEAVEKGSGGFEAYGAAGFEAAKDSGLLALGARLGLGATGAPLLAAVEAFRPAEAGPKYGTLEEALESGKPLSNDQKKLLSLSQEEQERFKKVHNLPDDFNIGSIKYKEEEESKLKNRFNKKSKAVDKYKK